MTAESIEWKGSAEFQAALTKMIDDAHAATKTALVAAAQIGVTEAQASFGSASGPQSVSGALSGSITHTDPSRQGESGYQVQVGPSGVPYARRVELGKAGARSAGPHPYFKPGWKRAGSRFEQVFHDEWAKVRGR